MVQLGNVDCIRAWTLQVMIDLQSEKVITVLGNFQIIFNRRSLRPTAHQRRTRSLSMPSEMLQNLKATATMYGCADNQVYSNAPGVQKRRNSWMISWKCWLESGTNTTTNTWIALRAHIVTTFKKGAKMETALRWTFKRCWEHMPWKSRQRREPL